MKRTVFFIISVIFLFSSCALEIANVIGPGGGYVFYDKGNYDGGWRYIECSSFDFGEIKDVTPANIQKALDLCEEHSGGWYRFGWELPEEADLKKMLECFSYGLTKFSSDYYYISANPKEGYDSENPSPDKLDPIVLHKNFDNKLNGEVEQVKDYTGVIRIRPIRRF